MIGPYHRLIEAQLLSKYHCPRQTESERRESQMTKLLIVGLMASVAGAALAACGDGMPRQASLAMPGERPSRLTLEVPPDVWVGPSQVTSLEANRR
jgi:hypothetical protein